MPVDGRVVKSTLPCGPVGSDSPSTQPDGVCFESMSVSPGRAGYMVARKRPPLATSVSAGCTATVTRGDTALPAETSR